MSPRLLVVAPFPPRLDAPSGGGRALGGLLVRLAEHCELALIHLRAADEPPVDAAVADACAVLEAVRREPIGRSPRRAWRERRRIGLIVRRADPWTVGCSVAALGPRLRDLARSWRPDVVQLEFAVMLQHLDALPTPRPPTVLVDHDPGPAGAELERVDAVVVFTERDRTATSARTRARVVRIPLAIDAPTEPPAARGSGPPTILFAGNYTHAPNVDAARRLVFDVFPHVRERRPDARLVIVGDRPPADVEAAGDERVTVTGLVADVEPYLTDAAVVAAPIHAGGGMRVKVLEALAAGKALVATQLAVEGTGAVAGEHYVAAEDAHEFAERIVELIERPGERAALGARAAAWTQTALGWDATVRGYLELYDELLGARR